MSTNAILAICIVVLLVSNIIIAVIKIRKSKSDDEVSMSVDDYLTLIMETLDQVAGDTIKLIQKTPKQYNTLEEYELALVKATKEQLFEYAEEYGISRNVLDLIDTVKLDEYIYDSVIVALDKNDNKGPEIKEVEEPEIDEVVEDSSKSDIPEQITFTDITKDLNNIYDDVDEV